MGLSTGLVVLTALSVALRCRSYSYSWPDPTVDQLESILYQQTGFDSIFFASAVSPCNSNDFAINANGTITTGRTTSAEWIRTAYHDQATANVAAGTGGVDASIGFESDRPENVGKFINSTLQFLSTGQSPVVSMADLIALGATLAIGVCSNGSVIVPYSAGRIDATEAGPTGVPQPQEPLATHIAEFALSGFNETDMIKLVACGHTLGGVHGADFPTIVPVLDDPNNQDSRVDFDATVASFDNSIATQFVNNVTQNPLAFGPNVTTRSDFRIFTSDGGHVIGQFAQSQDHFFETCAPLLARMLNTVPAKVDLKPISPILVKPSDVSLALNDNGTLLFTGTVRLLQGEVASPTNAPSVNILYTPRNGKPCSKCAIAAISPDDNTAGSIYTNTPTFAFYQWSATIPVSVGISGFSVQVINDGHSDTYQNPDGLFPMQDSVILQLQTSCQNNTFEESGIANGYHVVAAVLDSAHATDVAFVVSKPIVQPGSVAVAFVNESVVLKPGAAIGTTGYTAYSANASVFVAEAASVAAVSGGVTAKVGGRTVGDPYTSLGLNFCVNPFTGI